MHRDHINQPTPPTRSITSQPERSPNTLINHIEIPTTESVRPAEDELDRGIEQFERFGPLPCFVCVLLFCVFFDLPGAPDFVAESPVFDLSALLV